MTESTQSLPDLLKAVEEATSEYEEAERRLSIARNIRTDYLNHLNNLQRQVDAALAELRKAAPGESDWRREKGEPAC